PTRVSRRMSARVEGDLVPRDMWSRVRVRSGSLLTVRAVPAFEGGDFLKTVLQVAVVLAATILPAVIFPAGGIMAALLGAGIIIGGQLLISALFPVPPAQLKKEREQVYSIRGGQNTAEPF